MTEFIVKYYPQGLIIIGVLLQVWGGTILFHRTQNYRSNANISRENIEKLNEEINKKNNSIFELSKKNENLNSENNLLNKESAELSKENRELNFEIRTLSNRISEQSKIIENQVTGGDGYCFIRFYSLGLNGKGLAGFKSKSNYPVYINEVKVINLDCIDQLVYFDEQYQKNAIQVEHFQRCVRVLRQIEIPPGDQITPWNEASMTNGFPSRILINFQTRAGIYIQRIVFQEKAGKILAATQIERDGKIRDEFFDDGMDREAIDFSIVQMPDVVIRDK